MESAKIIISNDADRSLESMLKTVNGDFPSGRVKKSELASWIIKEFEARSFLKSIDKIREDHFDEIAHLKSVLKQMEEAKKSAQGIELDRLLNPLRGRSPKVKPKNHEEPSTKSDHQEEGTE